MTNDILNQMIDKAQTRREKWATTLTLKLPSPQTMRETVIVGSFTRVGLNSRRRILLEPATVLLSPDLKEAPSAAARDYLNIIYKKSPRIFYSQLQKLKGQLKYAPVLATPQDFDYGFYIDIKSTYWDILNIIGWNLDYNPGKWLMQGRPPFDFPFGDHKTSRNCLVSSSQVTQDMLKKPKMTNEILIYQPDKGFNAKQTGNNLINIQLSTIIFDILNSISEQAKQAGAIYINTDGFIAPDYNAGVRISQVILNWGLIPRVKEEGPGFVLGPGTYKVGSKISELVKARSHTQPFDNISPPRYSSWLEKNFSFWAANKSTWQDKHKDI